jgi:hypothetical protein
MELDCPCRFFHSKCGVKGELVLVYTAIYQRTVERPLSNSFTIFVVEVLV